jgi:hypothetical protein
MRAASITNAMMVAVHTPDMSFYFNETTKAKAVPPYAMEVLGGRGV